MNQIVAKKGLSKELTNALNQLFGEQSRWTLLLGMVRLPFGLEVKAPSDSSEPYQHRVKSLLDTLERYICQKAEEVEEFDNEDDWNRLQAETVGLLLALREIRNYFPEIN